MQGGDADPSTVPPAAASFGERPSRNFMFVERSTLPRGVTPSSERAAALARGCPVVSVRASGGGEEEAIALSAQAKPSPWFEPLCSHAGLKSRVKTPLELVLANWHWSGSRNEHPQRVCSGRGAVGGTNGTRTSDRRVLPGSAWGFWERTPFLCSRFSGRPCRFRSPVPRDEPCPGLRSSPRGLSVDQNQRQKKPIPESSCPSVRRCPLMGWAASLPVSHYRCALAKTVEMVGSFPM